ncbi:MAG: hypothetical protein ACYCTB_05340 [bacterium]
MIKKILTVGLTEEQYNALIQFQSEVCKKGFRVTRQSIFSKAFDIELKKIEKKLIELDKTDYGLKK